MIVPYQTVDYHSAIILYTVSAAGIYIHDIIYDNLVLYHMIRTSYARVVAIWRGIVVVEVLLSFVVNKFFY
jgi:hypothetical protein